MCVCDGDSIFTDYIQFFKSVWVFRVFNVTDQICCMCGRGEEGMYNHCTYTIASPTNVIATSYIQSGHSVYH